MTSRNFAFKFAVVLSLALTAAAQISACRRHPIVLHAARLLDVKSGRIVTPGEVLVQGERIVEVGTVGQASGGRGGDRSGRSHAAARPD